MAALYLAPLLVVLADHAGCTETPQYVGCLPLLRMMDTTGATVEVRNEIGLHQCVDHCHQSGTQYAAYLNNIACACVCLSSFPKYTLENDSACSVPCPEDRSKSCEARNGLSLYVTQGLNSADSHLSNTVPFVLLISVLMLFIAISGLILSHAFCRIPLLDIAHRRLDEREV